MEKGNLGYICMYRGKKFEVWANSRSEARSLACKHFKAKKEYEVDTYLCEKDGEQVTHDPAIL